MDNIQILKQIYQINDLEFEMKKILGSLMPDWEGVVKMNKEFMEKNNNKMETKRWKIEIGHEIFYKIATSNDLAIYAFFLENPRYLDCKYKISEVEEDGTPVEHHIILERLDKMVAEIYEIRKLLNKWSKVEVRVPDDGC